MTAADVRARLWNGPAIPGRAIEVTASGARILLPWTAAFSERDAMVAYAARPTIAIGPDLSLPCVVRWVSGGRQGLEFSVAFSEVDPRSLAALHALLAGSPTGAVDPPRGGTARRRHLRVPHDEPARLRRLAAHHAVGDAAAAGEWTAVTVLDMSATGCRVRGRRRLRPGERVAIRFEANSCMPLTAAVRWSRRGLLTSTAGLEFEGGDRRPPPDPALVRVPASDASATEDVLVPVPSTVSTALLARALESVSEGSLITDAERRTIYANSAFTTITGYGGDDIIGADCRLLQGRDTSPDTVRSIRESLRDGTTFRGEILNYRKNGTRFWNHLTITPIVDGAGRLTHFVSVQRDVTAEVEERERLAFTAEHDPLTGLPNRVGLRRHLVRTLGAAFQRGSAVAVVVLDLDRFKPVNDRHGHAVGDRVLVEIAARIATVLCEGDAVARLGGDEFVLVLDDLDPDDARGQVASTLERLREVVERPVVLAGKSVRVGASAGVALYPDDGRDLGDLLRAGDEALYRAKARTAPEQWWTAAGTLTAL